MANKVVALFCFVLLFSVSLHTTHAQEEVEDDPSTDVAPDLKAEKVPLKTDDDVIKREQQSIALEGYSEEELKLMEANAQRYDYHADVSKVMDIIVKSLYSNKEVFLRELISNASDALDKIRLQSLTDPAALGEVKNLDIRIKADKERNQLILTDTGVGMTKEDLIKNLGTIAQSGTKEFAAALSETANNNLIGQFGVGFYSAFLAAEKVTVTTKHNDDPIQWVWESTNASGFTITEDPKGNTLGRGTRITLHMRTATEDTLKETQEYLSDARLKELVRKYSEFINFPIYLWTSHEEAVEEEAEEVAEDEVKEDEVKEEEESEEEEEEEEEADKKAKTKTVWGWELVNSTKPIWTRSSSEVTEEEYINFYKAITKDTKDPLKYMHFSAEGDVEFKSLLYIPTEPPYGQFDSSTKHRGVKLYVKRVFITDDFDTVIPKYLGFVKGVVDSDDIPLNVSREMLQHNKVLDVIKKKLVRKAIAMFQELAEDEEKFASFWKNYSTNIKLGIIEDTQNRTRLAKLLRYFSTKTENQTSLDDYISRKKEGQDQIYYLAGDSIDNLRNSPLLEKLVKKGFEVLLMVDPIDEYTMQNLAKYDSKYKLTNLGHEGVKFDDEEAEDNKEDNDEKFKPLIDFLSSKLKDKVGRVKVSNRLTRSPCALVAESWGYTATMERVVKAQALSDPAATNTRTWVGRKVMEINPSHPLMVELNRLVKEQEKLSEVEDTVQLLFESAALTSGYAIDDPNVFAARIQRIMASSLDVELSDEMANVPPVPKKEEEDDPVFGGGKDHDEL